MELPGWLKRLIDVLLYVYFSLFEYGIIQYFFLPLLQVISLIALNSLLNFIAMITCAIFFMALMVHITRKAREDFYRSVSEFYHHSLGNRVLVIGFVIIWLIGLSLTYILLLSRHI